MIPRIKPQKVKAKVLSYQKMSAAQRGVKFGKGKNKKSINDKERKINLDNKVEKKEVDKKENKKVDKIVERKLIQKRVIRNINEIPHYSIRIAYSKTDGNSPLNKIFGQTYLINLRKRPGRLALMRFKLEDLGINYHKVDAIDGSKHQDEFWRYKSNGLKTVGAYGLLATFVGIFKHAIRNKYESILILEDDCSFHKNFNNLIENKKGLINFEKHPIIYLGATQYRWNKKINEQINNNKYYFPDNNIHTYGTFAIGFHKSMFNRILKTLNFRKIAVDNSIIAMYRREKITPLVFCPNLIIPDRTTSDIQKDLMINSGNNIIKSYGRFKWNIDSYDFFSIYNFDKIYRKIRNIQFDEINISKTTLINKLKNNQLDDKLINIFVKFILKDREIISNNVLNKIIKN